MTPEERAPEAYDFRKPTALAREQARALEVAFETFARQWGTQLTAKVRLMSRVTFEQLVPETYDDYVASLPATTGMVLCTVEGDDARAVVQFPPDAVLRWIAAMLGGTSRTGITDRRFTPIEQALVRSLVEDTLEDLSYSFGPLLLAHLSVEAVHYNTQFAQAAQPSELMVKALFTVRVADHECTASIALPASAVVTQAGAHSGPVSHEHDAVALVEHVSWAPVDVALRLKPFAITPARVLDLAVGDVIRLTHPQSRPFEVTIDGQTLAHAAVGSVGARLAGVIVETEES